MEILGILDQKVKEGVGDHKEALELEVANLFAVSWFVNKMISVSHYLLLYVPFALWRPGAPGDPGFDGAVTSEGNRGPAGAPGDTGFRGSPGKRAQMK